MRLIVALGAGVPMAAAQLLERMPDVPPATLYRHLTVLRQGGIITFADEPGPREAGERRTRGPGSSANVMMPPCRSTVRCR